MEVKAHLRQQLHPAHTALIVVDVQKAFTDEDSTLGKGGSNLSFAREAIPHMNGLIEAARRAGVHIIYLQHISSREMNLPNNYSFWGSWANIPPHEFSWEVEFSHDLMKPRAQDMTIRKYNYDAFSDTPLDLHLRARDIRTCVFLGIETAVCVETSARHAFIKGYHVVVASDCCGSCGSNYHDSKLLHEASLNILQARFGQVLTGKNIATYWM